MLEYIHHNFHTIFEDRQELNFKIVHADILRRLSTDMFLVRFYVCMPHCAMMRVYVTDALRTL